MSDWQGKKVVMIGAARQGIALTRYLAEKGASVILNDRRSDEELSAIRQELSDLNMLTRSKSSMVWTWSAFRAAFPWTCQWCRRHPG